MVSRFVLLTGTVVMLVVSLGCDKKEDTPVGGGSAPVATATTSSKKLTETDDVTKLDCQPGTGYTGKAVLTVQNRSTKPSTYLITVNASSADGSVLYGSASTSINGLAPNQSTTVDATFLDDVPAGAVCKLATVTRFATPS